MLDAVNISISEALRSGKQVEIRSQRPAGSNRGRHGGDEMSEAPG